jgi:hypothetical protein
MAGARQGSKMPGPGTRLVAPVFRLAGSLRGARYQDHDKEPIKLRSERGEGPARNSGSDAAEPQSPGLRLPTGC